MGEALVLTTMRFAHEIRSPKQLDLPSVKHGWIDKEMKLACQLMDTLSDELDPKEFKVSYTDVLRQVIEAKVEGKEVVAPEMPKRERVTNLMEALQQRLKSRPPAKAEGRKAAPKRARARRKAA